MSALSSMESYDVIVVGGGNTGLLTALRAHEAGAKVLVLEKAPKEFRGGNGYFTTGVYRIAHNGIEDVKDLIPDCISVNWGHGRVLMLRLKAVRCLRE